ncbi:MAG: RidA family protein, partial [Gammaproteobacteria bacterium]|nr:RidA family protein [Gammaproteobacteria bacterium]
MRLGGLPFEAVRIAGDRAVIAGHLPLDADGAIAGPLGKVGADVSPEEAYDAARRVALAMMASLEAAGIDLDRVEWRKVFGMVNAAPGFNALP